MSTPATAIQGKDSAGVTQEMGFVGDTPKVSLNGAITAVSGTPYTYSVAANAAVGSGDAVTEFITDATGYKGFTVDIIDDIAIGLDEALMVCWSTTVNDETATTATLDLLRGSLGTPDGVGYANTFVMTIHTGQPPVVLYDETTTIKTISVASQGTTSYDAVIRTVE